MPRQEAVLVPAPTSARLGPDPLAQGEAESRAEGQEEKPGKGRREKTTDTFKHDQPCSVIRVADRIARQAGILPSIL